MTKLKNTLQNIDKETNSRYSNRYHQHGVSHLTLGWGSRKHQEIRFKRILECINFNGQSVLDIGCGFGDLYSYLKAQNINISSYTGIDINPDLIAEAKNQNPDGIFKTLSITANNINIKADIVIMLGLLNFKQRNINNPDYAQLMIKNAYQSSNSILLVDCLSDRYTAAYKKEDFVYYYNPSSLLDWGFDLSDNVQLLHDYLPIPQKEMMLLLNKHPL